MHPIPFAKKISAAIAVAAIAACVPAMAAGPTTIATPLVVTATVLSTCVVVPTAIAFTDYSTTQGTAQGTIAVTCTPDVLSYQVALDAGAGSGASVSGGRKMTSLLGGTLTYNLYRDSGMSQTWGFTRNSDTVNSTGTLLQTYNVYAKLPGGQYPAAGAYTDSVNVTLLY